MTNIRLWRVAAIRYAEEVELRAQPLGSRFWCSFRDGALVLRLGYGEQLIGRDEFRAAMRLLTEGAAAATIRLVTKYPAHLAAVYEDLQSQVDRSSGEEDEGDADGDEEGAVEAILVEQARSLSRPAPQLVSVTESAINDPRESQHDEVGLDDVVRQLAAERAQKEELARQHARLLGEVDELRAQAEGAEGKAAELEVALRELRKKAAPAVPSIGRHVDWSHLGVLARREAASIGDPEHRRVVDEAADHLADQPRITVWNCRGLLEALAQEEYVRRNRSHPLPGNSSHAELMKILRDVPGVDRDFWHIRMTLYSMLSEIVHGRRRTDLRTVSMLLLVTALAAVKVLEANAAADTADRGR